MRNYFEQFGEILEAVVITDRVTGRSKGYGFVRPPFSFALALPRMTLSRLRGLWQVTFKDAECARRACADPTPIIDGRRANCNLASLGQKHRQQGGNPGRPERALGGVQN